MWYLLCREVLRLRGTVPRGPTGPSGWDVLPDLFFYRDPEEIEREAAEKAAAAAAQEGADADAAATSAAAGVTAEYDAGNAADAVLAAQPTETGKFLLYYPSFQVASILTVMFVALDWSEEPVAGDCAAEPAADAQGAW